MAFLRREQIIGKAAAGAMGGVAGAAGGGIGQSAEIFSKNLAKITKETYKAGASMFEKLGEIDFNKGTEFFGMFRGFVEQFGIFSAFLAPIMKLFEVFDSALMKEFSDVLVDFNQLMLSPEMIENVGNLAKGIRGLADESVITGGSFINLGKIINDEGGSIEYLTEAIEDLGEAAEDASEALDNLVVSEISDWWENLVSGQWFQPAGGAAGGGGWGGSSGGGFFERAERAARSVKKDIERYLP